MCIFIRARTGRELLLEGGRDGLGRGADVDAVVRRRLRVAEEAVRHVELELPGVEQRLMAVSPRVLSRPAGRETARGRHGRVGGGSGMGTADGEQLVGSRGNERSRARTYHSTSGLMWSMPTTLPVEPTS